MQFARKVWKLLVAFKDALALLFLLLFFGLIYGALASRPTPGRVVDGALLLDLDGVVVEERSEVSPLRLLLSAEAPAGEYQARDIERALRGAAKDDHVKAVVLDMSRFLGGGMVHLQEIGRAIDEVRAAGKPVLTFANAYADDGVLLAAHASEVWVDPMGGAFVAGPGGTQTYYKGLFDRFKVNAHVYRAGTYKSYVEPYIRSDMSPAAREANADLYGSIWATWKADVKQARPNSKVEQIAGDPMAWVEASKGDFAQGAKAAGLVDRIGDKTEFEKRVAEIAGKGAGGDGPAYAHTRLDTWLAANPARAEGASIGVITIAGEIVDGEAGPGKAGGDRIAQLLDDNIDEGFKALVVRVDSPGGSVMAAERIRRAIDRYKARKIPVVVSMANMAASGGYWVSTPAERIFAEPGTVTGSIGVFAVVTSFEKTLADFGVTSDGVRTTPLSGQPDILGGFTPEVERMLQASVDNIYGKFLGVVAKSRKTTPERIDRVAQGRVWPGAEAKELGLVDEMGDLDAALAYAAKQGGVGNGKWHAEYIGAQEGRFESMLRRMFAGPSDSEAVYDLTGQVAARQEARARRIAAQFADLTGSRGAQAYCLECPDLPSMDDPREAGQGLSLMARIGALAGLK
ncbi:signal peptide peptidase SppA [Novosphingobium sp. PY1]|uniref:signal peptide peptidase SppA n=1 Tax=Novosphingobium sp. PY1 TaxID=1882221 RepID=UPI001A8F3E74|nr:signal peptide peptidase SppA [Novosphingobium sp. PY1]GFM29982.1 protease IV [Novosphingobium sp. PY1]